MVCREPLCTREFKGEKGGITSDAENCVLMKCFCCPPHLRLFFINTSGWISPKLGHVASGKLVMLKTNELYRVSNTRYVTRTFKKTSKIPKHKIALGETNK